MNHVKPETAIERKYPEWIFQVVAIDGEGVPNAMPAGWCSFVSGNPIMMSVSVAFTRYTHELLEESEDFVLSFPGKDQREAVYYCGTNSGRDVNKFKETDLSTVPARKIETPLIEDSVACFECKKRDSLDAGDHTIYVGEVVATHVSEHSREKIYTTRGWHERGADGFKTIKEIKSDK